MRAARVGALAIALVPAFAPAQVPTTPPPIDTVATHHLALDIARLKPATFVYAMTQTRDTLTIPLGERTVSVSVAMYANAPAFQLLETRTGLVPSSDTLFAAPTDLHPMHWGAAIGPAHLAAEFSGDTIFGGTEGPPGRNSFVLTPPGSVMASAAMFETALRLLPLQLGWRDSTSVLSITLAGAQTLPAILGVTAQDSVQVPAGRFDCWVVLATTRGAQATYWVTKTDPVVVRVTLVPGGPLGGEVDYVLTRQPQ